MKKTGLILIAIFLAIVLVLLIAGNAAFLPGPTVAQNNENPYLVRIFVDDEGRQIDEIIVPGRPPEIKAPVATVPEPNPAMGINTLSNVPAFDWCYGCSATSAAMMAGYYDNHNYTNMYAGPTNGGVCPMNNSVWGSGECPLSATHQGKDGLGVKGHVDDYWYSYGSNIDPYYGNWAQHTYANCTADYMGTNQYHNWQNIDGATRFYFYSNGDPLYDYTGGEPGGMRDGCHGMKLFVESRGYSVVTNFNQYIKGQGSDPTKGFTFDNFTAEIDAGRPVLIQVTGHTMLGYGYNTTGQVIYIHDTWDYSNHTMTWGGTYSTMQHYGVTVIRLTPLSTLTMAVVGNGTTTPAPGTHSYVNGTVVNITATPSAYWNFVNWTTTGNIKEIANASAPSTTVLVDKDKTVTANFIRVNYTLTVNRTGQGSVSINGTTPASYPNTTSYPNGTVLNINATPDLYWYFVNWTGNVSDPNSPSTTVTVDANKTVTANFNRVNHTLAMLKTGNGTTNPASGGLYSYFNGTVVNITATPDIYWNFANWTGDTSTIGNVNASITNITMTDNYSITANFVRVNYNLAVDVTGQGNVTVNGTTPPSYPNTTTWANGTVVNITATPSAYWNFVNWTTTGNISEIANASAPSTTVLVDKNKTVTANFVRVNYNLAVNVTGQGNVTVNGTTPPSYPNTTTWANGTVVNITATPSAYWNFVNWTTTGNISEIANASAPSTTVLVDKNKTVTANFVRVNYNLAVNVTGQGNVTVNGTTPASYPNTTTWANGTVVNITATPDSQWCFVNWTTTDDISEIANASAPSTTVLVDKNKTVAANFCPQPLANFTANVTDGCKPLTVNFTDSSSGNIANWSWSFGDGNTSNDQSPTYTYNDTGIYLVNLTVTNAYNCSNTRTDSITVRDIPQANFTADVTAGCEPLVVNFTDTSSGIPSGWNWSFGDGNTSTEQNPSHTYYASTYNVTLNASNICGSNTTTKTGYITVNPTPTANFTADVTDGCKPLTVNFTDNSTGNITTWSWAFGDGNYSNDHNTTYTYNDSGFYLVNLTVTNDVGCSNTRTDSITVRDVPVVNFTATPRNGSAPLAVNFTDLSTGNPSGWNWSFGDGGNSTEANSTHTYTAAGNYTVNLTVDNACGSNTTSKTGYISVRSASPSPSGGGGGGGGGSTKEAEYYLSVTMFGNTSKYRIGENGNLTQAVEVSSRDDRINISLGNGTACLDKEGKRLANISVDEETGLLPLPENHHNISKAYRLEPEGATFNPYLNLALSYEDNDIPQNVSEEDIYIACYNATSESWVSLTSQVNAQNNTVTAPVSHFTTFAVMGTATPPLAEFTITSLDLSGSKVKPREEFTASATITNTGNAEGNYSVNLTINGKVEQTKTVTLAPAAAERVTFTISKDTPGIYTVSVDGLSGEFTVTPPSWLSRFLFLIVVAAIALGAILAYLVYQRRGRA